MAMRCLQEFVKAKPASAFLYVSFIGGLVALYKFMKYEHEYDQHDYILTLTAGFQTLAFAQLNLEMGKDAGEGLSEKMLWAFSIAQIARLSTTVWGEGYVPMDNTADIYLYQIVEVLGVLLIVFQLLKLAMIRNMQDVGQGSERWILVVIMTTVSGGLAYVTKSNAHGDYIADLVWMFSVWLEAFAVIPQVQLLWKHSRATESMQHFVALNLVASMSFVVFWGLCTQAQYTPGLFNFFTGILSAGCIRVGLCAYYLHLFAQAKARDDEDFKCVLC